MFGWVHKIGTILREVRELDLLVRRLQMSVDDILAKLPALEASVTRIEAGVELLKTGAVDPTKLQTVGDGIDAAVSRLNAIDVPTS